MRGAQRAPREMRCKPACSRVFRHFRVGFTERDAINSNKLCLEDEAQIVMDGKDVQERKDLQRLLGAWRLLKSEQEGGETVERLDFELVRHTPGSQSVQE